MLGNLTHTCKLMLTKFSEFCIIKNNIIIIGGPYMTEFLSKFSFKENDYSYLNLEEAVSHYGGNIKRIPYTIRILLESLLRKYPCFSAKISRSARRAIVPSSLMISQMTDAGSKPARRDKSQPASV